MSGRLWYQVVLLRRRNSPAHVWALLCVIEPADDHLALGRLANVFCVRLDGVREQSETRCPLNSVHYEQYSEPRYT